MANTKTKRSDLNRNPNKGTRFNSLTFISRDPDSLPQRGRWIMRCDCGTVKSIRAWVVMTGGTKSCGCQWHKATTTHGRSKEKIYAVWINMIQRCTNPNSSSFKWYGERGIKVCERWLNSFERFYEDMAIGWARNLTIDRIDVNGHYDPANCRWANSFEQSINRTNNTIISFDGKTMTLVEWAKKTGIGLNTILSRFNYGWTVERALTTPVMKKG